MIRNLSVVGVGGVGGFFGGKLCQLQSEESDIRVYFVARGEHLRAILESGLLLETEHEGELRCKPYCATDDIDSLPSLDLCLLSVKEFDLDDVLRRLKPKIQESTIILPLLNGFDIYSRVRATIRNGYVFPACVYVGTHISAPGRVTQRGGACKILFGPDPDHPQFQPTELVTLFDQAKIKAEWTDRVQTEIWSKFIFIASYGLVSAAKNKTLGEILSNKSLTEEVRRVASETVSIAQGLGVILPAEIVEASINKGRNFPPETKTSFQRDFERRDKPDERNLFAGAILRTARQLRLDTPATRDLAAKLEQIKPSSPIDFTP